MCPSALINIVSLTTDGYFEQKMRNFNAMLIIYGTIAEDRGPICKFSKCLKNFQPYVHSFPQTPHVVQICTHFTKLGAQFFSRCAIMVFITPLGYSVTQRGYSVTLLRYLVPPLGCTVCLVRLVSLA